MNKKLIMIGIGLVCLLVLSGCIYSQEEIIQDCMRTYTILDCSSQACIYNKLNGYDGFEKARANYYECLYNLERGMKNEMSEM